MLILPFNYFLLTSHRPTAESMKNNSKNINILEQQISNNEDICCSCGNISSFPKAFFDNYHVAGTTAIRNNELFFLIKGLVCHLSVCVLTLLFRHIEGNIAALHSGNTSEQVQACQRVFVHRRTSAF